MALDAIIVGAGFGGLYQLHLLRDRLGLNVSVVEAGGGVGGTWYWNRYPGARCDTESHAYAYYFSDEILDAWDWSERYPGHAEIRRYLNFVCDKLDLKKDIRFNTRVTALRYDAARNLWVAEMQGPSGDTETVEARYAIAAVGCLSSANVPDIQGRDTFAGEWYHTGLWPEEGVDFTGKRVGVVGTGSTGIQAIPVIAEKAQHLTVFQRTPNFSVPARNQKLTDGFKQKVRDNRDEIRTIMHTNTNGHAFRIDPRSAFDVSERERQKIYEDAWAYGGLQFRGTFEDLLTNKSSNDTAVAFISAKIREVVKDPVKADILTRFDHPYAAKRPPIDSAYFEAYNRETVDLVDLRQTPIEQIEPDGIRTSDGFFPLDVIVFATGYDALTGTLLRLNITGRDGQKVADLWSAGPITYLGLQIPGCPNLFTVTGPGSPSVLTNMPVAIEQHVEWIANCIEHLESRAATRIEPASDAAMAWRDEVQAAADATLLPTVPHSWYLGANVPGKPRVFMPYAGGLAKYRAICEDVAADNYRGFEIA